MRGVLAGLGGLLALGASAAHAQDLQRFYVSGSLGGYVRETVEGPDSFFHTATPTVRVAGTDRIRFAPSVIGSVAAGYRISSHLRVEGELSYFRYHATSLNPSTDSPGFPNLNGQTFRRSSGDDYTRFTGTANLFYDIATIAGRYTPYVGAGVGASDDHQSEGLFLSASQSPFSVSGGSSTQGLALAEGGVAIAVTPHLSIVPAYRYVHFFAGNEDVAHVAKLGLRYSF